MGAAKSKRPTKKQYELLQFIDEFIKQHGYSPSYREIMRGLKYTSVATVALHVNNLVKRGHLAKINNSARTLEVVSSGQKTPENSSSSDLEKSTQELVNEAKKRQKIIQNAKDENSKKIAQHELEILLEAMQILGANEQAEKLKKSS